MRHTSTHSPAIADPATAITPVAPLGRPAQRSWPWRAVLHARGDEADVCRSVQVAVPVSQGTTGTQTCPCPCPRPNLHLHLPPPKPAPAPAPPKPPLPLPPPKPAPAPAQTCTCTYSAQTCAFVVNCGRSGLGGGYLYAYTYTTIRRESVSSCCRSCCATVLPCSGGADAVLRHFGGRSQELKAGLAAEQAAGALPPPCTCGSSRLALHCRIEGWGTSEAYHKAGERQEPTARHHMLGWNVREDTSRLTRKCLKSRTGACAPEENACICPTRYIHLVDTV